MCPPEKRAATVARGAGGRKRFRRSAFAGPRQLRQPLALLAAVDELLQAPLPRLLLLGAHHPVAGDLLVRRALRLVVRPGLLVRLDRLRRLGPQRGVLGRLVGIDAGLLLVARLEGFGSGR